MGIGYRIKEAREHLGLTQTELGNLVGVTGSAITNYEKETSHPKEQIIYRLMEALNVDANYLFQDAVHLPEKGTDITLTEYEYIKKYRSLDPYGQETVNMILDREVVRVKSLASQKDAIQELKDSYPISKPATVRYIQYYQRLASAGAGQIVFDDIPVDMLPIPDIPKYRKVKYAIGVNGRSMEPNFEDGDIVLVAPDEEVAINDIGIFVNNSGSVIKQRGKKTLISLNPDYDDIPLTSDTRCFGLVIDKYHPELDGSDIAALEEARNLLFGEESINKMLG